MRTGIVVRLTKQPEFSLVGLSKRLGLVLECVNNQDWSEDLFFVSI